VRTQAVDVLAEGLDAPYVTGGVDYGRVRRPIPLAKALDDALLAFEMNGETLPADHGFPVRLLVPGWIGIASIKWLGRLEVADTRIETAWNTKWYPGLSLQPVKSAFELPWDATLPAGERARLTGRSCSGHAPIERVEVSTDGGARWREAQLHGPNRPNGWVRWSLPWTPAPGRHELRARASDRSGLTQPDTVPFNGGGYQFWAVVRHPVTAA
jgi:DMSO/TMAO reductase YedYZ molybdopterin-dependent catalytic subunit